LLSDDLKAGLADPLDQVLRWRGDRIVQHPPLARRE
jgi:hypothetical protein